MLKKILLIAWFISVTSLSAAPVPYSTASAPYAVEFSDLIIIRVYAPLSKAETGVIKVYKNNEPVTSIELAATTDRDDNDVFLKIRETLNKYTTEGYSIVTSNTSFGPSFGGGLKIVTIYVLEKK